MQLQLVECQFTMQANHTHTHRKKIDEIRNALLFHQKLMKRLYKKKQLIPQHLQQIRANKVDYMTCLITYSVFLFPLLMWEKAGLFLLHPASSLTSFCCGWILRILVREMCVIVVLNSCVCPIAFRIIFSHTDENVRSGRRNCERHWTKIAKTHCVWWWWWLWW